MSKNAMRQARRAGLLPTPGSKHQEKKTLRQEFQNFLRENISDEPSRLGGAPVIVDLTREGMMRGYVYFRGRKMVTRWWDDARAMPGRLDGAALLDLVRRGIPNRAGARL